MMTSLTWSGVTPARRRASRTVTAPSCGAGTSASAPRYLPMGVRTAERISASDMTDFLVTGNRKGDLIPSIIRWPPGCTQGNQKCPHVWIKPRLLPGADIAVRLAGPAEEPPRVLSRVPAPADRQPSLDP